MLVFNNTNTQVSPCIAFKDRFVNCLKVMSPANIKRCSLKYCVRVIVTRSIIDNIKPDNQQGGLDLFNDLIN